MRLLILIGFIFLCSDSQQSDIEVQFKSTLISKEANLWWARTLADVDSDGILDVVVQDNNGSGGWLGYLKGNTTGKIWETVIVAELSPKGKPFAAGDLEAADIDNDGDIDLVGVEHPGEWTDADADATLYWYEQSGENWIPHLIGSIPSALKDISISDLDKDKVPEIITVTYNAETLTVFTMNPDKDFTKAWELRIDNLHEGLDTGDFDGDNDIDIATNGYWLENQGSMNGSWTVYSIDSMWYSQNEDHWARNATKTVCSDTDRDGRAEVFISHSEKMGYPIVKYDLKDGKWHKKIIADELPAAHSLIVEDIDQDGKFEVLSGVNRNRAINIAEEERRAPYENFPVIIFNQSENGWKKEVINTDGVYNLLAGDLEGDGDIDLIRLTSHDNKDMWLMENTLK